MIDPRPAMIKKQLSRVKRVIALSSGKGGVGKSSAAVGLALLLGRLGRSVGLLDLDFTGPSSHILLGWPGSFPREEKGIIPPKIEGVKLISVIYYTQDQPTIFRGPDLVNGLSELLAISRWGSLDYLIIDLPPGLSDPLLETFRLISQAEFIVISTPSRLALPTIRKNLQALQGFKMPILGIVENMSRPEFSIKGNLAQFNHLFLGKIAFDPQWEKAIGQPSQLLKTRFVRDLKKTIVAKKHL